MFIPFYSRFTAQKEQEYLEQCLLGTLDTNNRYTEQLTKFFKEQYKTPQLLFTPSCSHALELACHLLQLQPGDEVILPSFNFPSAANAVLLAGGTPVLCDIDPTTQNISVSDAENRITKHTRAIVAMHYAGVACDMESLQRCAQKYDLDLIEDAAQGIGAKYNERYLGTMGRFGAYSFHYTKNCTCGEGGAFFCGDKDLLSAEIFREKGTDRSRYIRGECDRYTWRTAGSSYLLGALPAALLLAQVEAEQQITAKRCQVMELYDRLLKPLAEQGYLQTMNVPSYAQPNGHIFYIRLPSTEQRAKVQQSLLDSGVEVHTHYVPLHLSQMGKQLGYAKGDLPESEKAYETLLRLPIHTNIAPTEQQYIAEVLTKAVGAT